MRKFGFVLILFVCSLLCMGNTGCEKVTAAKGKTDNIAGKVVFVANGVTFAVDAADPVVAELEKATGIALRPELVDSGIGVAHKAEQGLGMIGAIVGMVPGGAPVAAGLIALAQLASGIKILLEKRKKKEAQDLAVEINDEKIHTREALKTVIKAVDTKELPGVGKRITSATLAAGCADTVEGAYQEAIMEVEATVVEEKAA